MAQLYFYYSAMNAGKSTSLLQSSYNYQERGMRTLVLTAELDHRFGLGKVSSRIGLSSPAELYNNETDLFTLIAQESGPQRLNCVLIDECQFLTEAQIDQLRAIVDEHNVPVMCFGLRTDFQCHLFAGSRRLMEVADTIQEIKTICDCGAKATVNARIDSEGHIVTQGEQLFLGGNDSYIAMCHKCWVRGIREHKVIRLHGQRN